MNKVEIIQLAITTILFCCYAVIVYLDFRYREMKFWKPLLMGILNLSLLFLFNIFWGYKGLGWHFLGLFFLWLFFVFLNMIGNKERVIGRVDVDILTSQIVLVLAYYFYIKQTVTPEGVLMRMLFLLQQEFAAFFIGLILVVVVWGVAILYYKCRKKTTFKEAIKHNQNAPLTLAFFPVVLFNIALILNL